MHVLLVDLGSLAASKSAELAAICLAAGGADQAAQHKTGLHSGPRRAGRQRGAGYRSESHWVLWRLRCARGFARSAWLISGMAKDGRSADPRRGPEGPTRRPEHSNRNPEQVSKNLDTHTWGVFPAGGRCDGSTRRRRRRGRRRLVDGVGGENAVGVVWLCANPTRRRPERSSTAARGAGHLGDRVGGLGHDAHRAGPELPVTALSCFWHRSASF